MRSLLILLTLTAILAALFCGGCSLMWVGDFLWNGRRMYFDETAAWITTGVGLVAVAVLAANIWMLRSLLGRRGPRGRSLSKGVVLTLLLLDLVAALLSLGFVALFGGLGVLAAAVFAAKGLLTLRCAAAAPE
jgi:hypothetical protein